MDVIKLLKSKNRCLIRFRQASAEFLAEAETGDFDGLERFEIARESSLKAATLFDGKIGEAVERLTRAEKTPELVRQVQALMAEKEAIVREIARIDQNVMAHIERERERLVRELSAHRKTSEVMRKFKSEWMPSPGEELDQKL